MLLQNTVSSVFDVVYTVDESAQTITVTGKRNFYPACAETFTESESMFETLQQAPFYLDENAARFVCEWIPEYIYTVADICEYFPYAWQTFAQMDESEFCEYLHNFDYDGQTVDENEYCERYGATYRDAAFSGVLVIGE